MIPDRVKVGGIYYDVIVTDEVLLLDNKQCQGLIDYQKTTIKLAGNSVLSEQARIQTFFHELVHAFTHSRNLDWGDKNELYTDEIGNALHSFFIDNNIPFAQAEATRPVEVKPKAAKHLKGGESSERR